MSCSTWFTLSHLLKKGLQCSLRPSETPATHRASAHEILSTSGLSGDLRFSKMLHQRSNTGARRLTRTGIRIKLEMGMIENRIVYWCEITPTCSLAIEKAADLLHKEPQKETLSHISDPRGPQTTDSHSRAERAHCVGWPNVKAAIRKTLLWTTLLPRLPGRSFYTLHCGSVSPPSG